MKGYDSSIPERYYLPSGELTPEGIRYYNQQVKTYSRPAGYEGRAYLLPYSEVTVGGETHRNNTDTTQEFSFSGYIEPSEWNIELYFGRLPGSPDPDPLEIGYVELSRIVPLFEVFQDTFGSLIQASWMPDSEVTTEMNDWTLEYFSQNGEVVLDDYSFIVEDGFTFEVEPDGTDYQGFRLRKSFSEPRSTNVVLNINSEIIKIMATDDSTFENDRAAEMFYHGVWLFGDSWLWVHMTEQGSVTDEAVIYPATTPDGSTDSYSMVEIGESVNLLDLSQFSEILGAEINELIIEACAYPRIM